jgi:hypothetical protein
MASDLWTQAIESPNVILNRRHARRRSVSRCTGEGCLIKNDRGPSRSGTRCRRRPARVHARGAVRRLGSDVSPYQPVDEVGCSILGHNILWSDSVEVPKYSGSPPMTGLCQRAVNAATPSVRTSLRERRRLPAITVFLTRMAYRSCAPLPSATT